MALQGGRQLHISELRPGDVIDLPGGPAAVMTITNPELHLKSSGGLSVWNTDTSGYLPKEISRNSAEPCPIDVILLFRRVDAWHVQYRGPIAEHHKQFHGTDQFRTGFRDSVLVDVVIRQFATIHPQAAVVEALPRTLQT